MSDCPLVPLSLQSSVSQSFRTVGGNPGHDSYGTRQTFNTSRQPHLGKNSLHEYVFVFVERTLLGESIVAEPAVLRAIQCVNRVQVVPSQAIQSLTSR